MNPYENSELRSSTYQLTMILPKILRQICYAYQRSLTFRRKQASCFFF